MAFSRFAYAEITAHALFRLTRSASPSVERSNSVKSLPLPFACEARKSTPAGSLASIRPFADLASDKAFSNAWVAVVTVFGMSRVVVSLVAIVEKCATILPCAIHHWRAKGERVGTS